MNNKKIAVSGGTENGTKKNDESSIDSMLTDNRSFVKHNIPNGIISDLLDYLNAEHNHYIYCRDFVKNYEDIQAFVDRHDDF